MKPKVMPREELGEQLSAWNRAILEQDFSKADDIHKTLAHICAAMNEDDQQHLLYLLLEVRSHLMKKQFSLAKASLSNIYPHLLDEPALFYYHFFKGMIASSEKSYQEAVTQYRSAENYLPFIDDEVEKAEFYYQISGTYYYVVHTWESINYLQKAKSLYFKIEGYEKRKASCSVGLGLNLIDIKQYEQAEVELLQALDIAVKTDDKELKKYIYHNLGLFYSNQNLSSIAIRYLKEIESTGFQEDHPGYLRNIFLLAQEYCKIGDIKSALPYYEIGIAYSKNTNDEEYLIKFSILDAIYFKQDKDYLQNTLINGIKFFQKNNMWASVQWYSEILAERFYHEKKYKKASDYYALFIECNKKINEMGALK